MPPPMITTCGGGWGLKAEGGDIWALTAGLNPLILQSSALSPVLAAQQMAFHHARQGLDERWRRIQRGGSHQRQALLPSDLLPQNIDVVEDLHMVADEPNGYEEDL